MLISAMSWGDRHKSQSDTYVRTDDIRVVRVRTFPVATATHWTYLPEVAQHLN